MWLKGLSVVLSTVVGELTTDVATYSAPATAVRVMRKARATGESSQVAQLRALPAFRAHLARLCASDQLFFASHRHYLAKGLSLTERIDAAERHYRLESTAWTSSYLDAVYRSGGLVLWREEVAGIAYHIRLCIAHDVPYEGGLSVVFFVDGQRTCVLSLSHVPSSMLGGGTDRLVPFVTRKQTASDHRWQGPFNKAFNRVTAPHLCFAAIEGLTQTLGGEVIAGIAPAAHPAASPELAERFERAYGEFWQTLGGKTISDRALLVTIPGRRRADDDPARSAAHRKRNEARRAVAARVRESTMSVLSEHRAVPGVPLLAGGGEAAPPLRARFPR